MPESSHPPSGPRSAGALSLGLEMAVPIVVFGWIGYVIDERFGTLPGFALGGGILGVGVAFYSFYKRVLMMQEASKDELTGASFANEEPDSSQEEPTEGHIMTGRATGSKAGTEAKSERPTVRDQSKSAGRGNSDSTHDGFHDRS